MAAARAISASGVIATRRHCAVNPPSAMTTAPVMKLDAGEARKTMMRAISPGEAMRPSGCDAPMSAARGLQVRRAGEGGVDERGVDGAGGDRVDAHAVGGVLDRQLPRDLGDRALGRAVGALRREPDDARDRRDVDDRATAALDQVRQRLPAVDEDAAHVGGHQPVPLLVRRLDDRLEQEAARVVDDDVEAPEAGQGEVDRAARAVRVGGVRAQGGDPVVREPLDGRVDVLGDDLRAGGTQLGDDLAADAAGGAGDDRHGAVEGLVVAAPGHLRGRDYRMIVIQCPPRATGAQDTD